MSRAIIYVILLAAVLPHACASEQLPDVFQTLREGDLTQVRTLILADPGVVRARRDDGTTPLHLAADSGNLELARLLLANGAEVDARATTGVTPLHWAAIGDHSDMVKLLLANGADANAKEGDGTTPLYMAAGWGSTETVEVLIRAGANIEAPGRDGKSPLVVAAAQGDNHLDTMRLLIKSGAHPNGGADKPLYVATKAGWKRAVKLLLDHKADIAIRDSDGCTLLHIAASGGLGYIAYRPLISRGTSRDVWIGADKRRDHEGVAQLLIANGADVNARDTEGRSVLSYSARSMHCRIADLLLKTGAKPDLSEPNLLYFAVASGARNLARTLIAQGADVNAVFQDWSTEAGFSSTPLHAAVDAGVREIVELLLSKGARNDVLFDTPLNHTCLNGDIGIAALLLAKGADVNGKCDGSAGPLHVVAGGLCRTTGRPSPMMLRMARFLISKGANVNARDGLDQTPLFSVTESEMAKMLLDHGADPSAKNRLAETPLHCAAGNGLSSIVALLLGAGSDVKATDQYCQTPLHRAAQVGNQECAALLLDAGAVVNARSYLGWTPLHVAGSAAVAKVLIEHGADVRAKANDGKTPLDYAVGNDRKAVAELLRDVTDG